MRRHEPDYEPSLLTVEELLRRAPCTGDVYARTSALIEAIDNVAELLTGDREYFWLDEVSIREDSRRGQSLIRPALSEPSGPECPVASLLPRFITSTTLLVRHEKVRRTSG